MIDADMYLHELATTGQEMRRRQKRYFKSRDPDVFLKCKQTEKEFDQMVDRYFKSLREDGDTRTIRIKIL